MMKDFVKCVDKLSDYFYLANDISNTKRYVYTGNKYKLSINIFVSTREGLDYVKCVMTNCHIDCCGFVTHETVLTNRQLKKLIETGIYNYGNGVRSY